MLPPRWARRDLPAVGVHEPRRRERAAAVGRGRQHHVTHVIREHLPPEHVHRLARSGRDVDAAADTRLSAIESQGLGGSRAAVGDPRQHRGRLAVTRFDPRDEHRAIGRDGEPLERVRRRLVFAQPQRRAPRGAAVDRARQHEIGGEQSADTHRATRRPRDVELALGAGDNPRRLVQRIDRRAGGVHADRRAAPGACRIEHVVVGLLRRPRDHGRVVGRERDRGARDVDLVAATGMCDFEARGWRGRWRGTGEAHRQRDQTERAIHRNLHSRPP